MLTPVAVAKLALLKMAASWLVVTVVWITVPVVELLADTTTTPSVVLLLITLTAKPAG